MKRIQFISRSLSNIANNVDSTSKSNEKDWQRKAISGVKSVLGVLSFALGYYLYSNWTLDASDFVRIRSLDKKISNYRKQISSKGLKPSVSSKEL